MSTTTLDRYRYENTAIASDAFGTMFEGVDTTSQQPVLVKALTGHRQDGASEGAVVYGRTVSHPSLVLPAETLFAQGATFAILPRPNGGLLRDRLKTLLTEGIDGRHRLLSALADVCKVVESLHAVGIVHGQINPTSVLVGSDGQPGAWLLLCDRFAPRQAEDYVAAPDCLAYVPQEQLRGGGSFQADIYAVAMLVHTSFSRTGALLDGSAFEQAEQIVWGALSPFVANLDGLAPKAADALALDVETLGAVAAKGLQRAPTARYLTMGELRRAIEELCRRMQPFALGQRLHREGRFVEAAAVFDEATTGSQAALAHIFLGRIRGLHLEDYEAGIVSFRRALKMEPNLESARLGLAEIYLRQKRYPMAKREYEELLSSRPSDMQLLTGYANVLYSSGNLEGALNILRRVQAENPYVLQPFITAIQISLARGLLKEAEHDSRTAAANIAAVLQLGNLALEEVAEVFYLRGVVFDRMGHRENAIRWAEKALGIIPLHVASRKLLAEAYSALGRVDKAMEHFLMLLQIEPGQEGIVAAVGRILAGQTSPTNGAN
jgi:tetratricopeptide (TPR) repeat protein